VYPFGDELHYADRRAGADASMIADEVRAHLVRHGHPDATVQPIRAHIEDSFMARMGEGSRPDGAAA
jgi:hypothetical protein